jgi:hypothetical protein
MLIICVSHTRIISSHLKYAKFVVRNFKTFNEIAPGHSGHVMALTDKNINISLSLKNLAIIDKQSIVRN